MCLKSASESSMSSILKTMSSKLAILNFFKTTDISLSNVEIGRRNPAVRVVRCEKSDRFVTCRITSSFCVNPSVCVELCSFGSSNSFFSSLASSSSIFVELCRSLRIRIVLKISYYCTNGPVSLIPGFRREGSSITVPYQCNICY